MYKYAWKILTEMEIYGNGKFWKLTYIHRGGKVRKPKFPTVYNLRQKKF